MSLKYFYASMTNLRWQYASKCAFNFIVISLLMREIVIKAFCDGNLLTPKLLS